MRFIRLVSPVKEAQESRLDDARWNAVSTKFKRHQEIAEGLCLAGLIGGIFIPAIAFRPFQVWDVGIAFGAMCCLPLAYIIAVCCKNGFRESWNDFADFSTMKYSIPWNTQLGIFIFFGLTAAVSVLGRIYYPIIVQQNVG
ncbi:hypothetical protein OAG71_00700 [bacterium]|nr:hypothetical protein [bacterium]